jgi:DNA-binding MarR family transcriptional regulator
VRRLRSQRGEADLPEHLFVVLTALNKFGSMTPGALADLEGVRPPSMTRTVNALCELGFVTKNANEDDKRQVSVSLTPQGRSEIKETRRRRDAWLTKQLGTLSPEDRQVLAQASELLKRIAGQ